MVNKRMPVLVQDRLLISPGIWNDNNYSAEEISQGFARTDWSDKDKISLWLNHDDRNTSAFVGYVRNPRLESGGKVFGDLELWDEQTAVILTEAMAKFGVSAKIAGSEDAKTGKMSNFRFENFSIVTTPACAEAYINLSKKEDDTVSKYLVYDEKKEESEILESDLKSNVRRLKNMGEEEEKKEEIVEEATEEAEAVKENSQKELLENLNTKFDKLIELLSKKELAEEEPAEVVEEEASVEEAPVEEAKEVEAEAPAEEAPEEDKELSAVKKELAELKAKLDKPSSKTSVKVLSSSTVGNNIAFDENVFCNFLGAVESPMKII